MIKHEMKMHLNRRNRRIRDGKDGWKRIRNYYITIVNVQYFIICSKKIHLPSDGFSFMYL
jgi:hypothetical protein